MFWSAMAREAAGGAPATHLISLEELVSTCKLSVIRCIPPLTVLYYYAMHSVAHCLGILKLIELTQNLTLKWRHRLLVTECHCTINWTHFSARLLYCEHILCWCQTMGCWFASIFPNFQAHGVWLQMIAVGASYILYKIYMLHIGDRKLTYPAWNATHVHCYPIQPFSLKACSCYGDDSTTMHASDLRSYVVNICINIHGINTCHIMCMNLIQSCFFSKKVAGLTMRVKNPAIPVTYQTDPKGGSSVEIACLSVYRSQLAVRSDMQPCRFTAAGIPPTWEDFIHGQ